MILKIKHPNGVSKLTLNDDILCSNFFSEICKLTGYPIDELEIAVGFPPIQLEQSDDILNKKLEDIVKSGSLVSINRFHFLKNPINQSLFRELRELGYVPKIIKKALEVLSSPDLNSAIDLCESIKEGNFVVETSMQQSLTPIISKLSRKIIPANNSCLFNSIDFILSQNSTNYYEEIYGEKLRDIVSSVIAQELHLQEIQMAGSNFTPRFLPILEMPPLQYINWILQSTNWGGEVENVILANHLNCIIHVYDIRTCLRHSYGAEDEKSFYNEEEGNLQKKHIFLLYDGVHYDPLIGLNSQSNEIRFFTSKSDVEKFHRLADEFVKDLNKKKKFVNLSSGDFLCNVCLKSFSTQKDAMEHAKLTGHTNFGHK